MADSNLRFPRVTIQFCTQCKWNLRAAYFAQELLQTFSTSLGEISLQPSTGGDFKVDIYTSSSSPSGPSASSPSSSPPVKIQHTPLWDRKTDGGFPETKELKRRVRDVVEPGRNLGHVDRDYTKKNPTDEPGKEGAGGETAGKKAERGGVAEGESRAEQEAERGHHQVLPRPRDIAARAAHTPLTHPPDAPQPHQREWGTRESDRILPGGGVGGTKPVIPGPEKTHSAQDGQQRGETEGRDGEARPAKCEDCE